MSGLWNPYAFSVTGQPLAPPTPPALRVYGSQASEAQLAMAQLTFARFCATSRLSAVINPTERGRLADGTEYRIVVLGNTPIMEISPRDATTPRNTLSGIGVTTQTAHWLLVPKDGWRSEKHEELHGGLGYCSAPGTAGYYSEAPGSINANNKEVAGGLCGQVYSVFTTAEGGPSDVSWPFIFSGRLCQIKAADSELLLKYRALEGMTQSPDAAPLEARAELPGPGGWGLVTSKGADVLLCRQDDIRVPLISFVCTYMSASADAKVSVVEPVGEPARLAINVESSRTGLSNSLQRTPPSAPEIATWQFQQALQMPTPIFISAPHPNGSYTIEGSMYSQHSRYTEDSVFFAEGTHREYMLHGSKYVDVMTSKNTQKIKLTADLVQGGFDTEGYVDWSDSQELLATVETRRNNKLRVASCGEVELYDTSVDCRRSVRVGGTRKGQYGGPIYGPGGIIGYDWPSSVDCWGDRTEVSLRIGMAREVILFADSNLGVMATVRASLELDHTSLKGWPGGSSSTSHGSSQESYDRHDFLWACLTSGVPNWRPGGLVYEYANEKTDNVEVRPVVIRLWVGGAVVKEMTLRVPKSARDAVAEDATIMRNLTLRLAELGRNVPPGTPSGEIENLIPQEPELRERLDDLIHDRLGDVFYVTDPHTKSGFFSYSWDGEVSNYIVDPNAFTPSGTLTPVATNARVLRAVSI